MNIEEAKLAAEVIEKNRSRSEDDRIDHHSNRRHHDQHHNNRCKEDRHPLKKNRSDQMPSKLFASHYDKYINAEEVKLTEKVIKSLEADLKTITNIIPLQ